MEVMTGCLGVVIVGFSELFWGFLCVFGFVGVFYLNHDKVKLEFITRVISDIAICRVLYA